MLLGSPLNSGTSRHIAAPSRYAPSLRLTQTATCFPNSAERCPILIHTEYSLYSSEPHGACGCLRRPSWKNSCRCTSSMPRMRAALVTSTRPAWTSHCHAGMSKKYGILPRNRLRWSIISRQWCLRIWLVETSLVVQGSPNFSLTSRNSAPVTR